MDHLLYKNPNPNRRLKTATTTTTKMYENKKEEKRA